VRVLIVDDEPHARAKLRRMLDGFPDIHVVGEAVDGADALRRCAQQVPQAIFLDMQMPELDGFGVVARLPHPRPSVVMVTAFEEHALHAFDAEVMDYLLKPVAADRLERTIRRLRTSLAGHRSGLAPLADFAPNAQFAAAPGSSAKLLISMRGKTEVVFHSSIEWLESADNYVHLHAGGKSFLIRRTLANLLDELGARFVRVHRCFAVPVDRVEGVHARGKGEAMVALRGGRCIPCSRQHKLALLEKLQSG
jgi:two-component system LytT family response regulator